MMPQAKFDKLLEKYNLGQKYDKRAFLESIITTPRDDHPARKPSRKTNEINVKKRGVYYPNPPDCTGIRNIRNREGIVTGIRYN